jgi:hypothetical protein
MLPFGGGQVVALASQAQIDLLTIEYRDAHNAYLGAVFALPHSQATRAKEAFSSRGMKIVDAPGTRCKNGVERKDVIRLAALTAPGLRCRPSTELFFTSNCSASWRTPLARGGVPGLVHNCGLETRYFSAIVTDLQLSCQGELASRLRLLSKDNSPHGHPPLTWASYF